MGESMIAEAMNDVFGDEPQDGNQKIGYNIARMRFEGMIKQAEPVLQGEKENDEFLELSLRRAFGPSSLSGLEPFPADTQQMVLDIARRFETRYATLAPDA